MLLGPDSDKKLEELLNRPEIILFLSCVIKTPPVRLLDAELRISKSLSAVNVYIPEPVLEVLR